MDSTNNISQQGQENENLEICRNDLQQARDSLLRLGADFDNYKRRIEKEKINWIEMVKSDMLLDILDIVDNFDRAMSEQKKTEQNKDLSAWLFGFEMIYKSLYKFLEQNSVKEITNFASFDPEFHEAISQIESEGRNPGDIVSVAQKGFMLKDKVLRPAKVIVAK